MAWSLVLRRPGAQTLVFLLFTAFFHITNSLSPSPKCNELNTNGVTIPKGDIIIEHGNPIEIFCILHDESMNQHGYTSKDIMFKKNDDEVPQEWVDVVNASTLRLYVEKPPPSRDMYYCKMKDSPEAICLNAVVVGTKPDGVKNFSCVSYNYDNLTCSWYTPQHYVKTNYNLSYHFPGRNARLSYSCPGMNGPSNKTEGWMHCFWDIATRPHYRQTLPLYNFRLFMSNVFGNYTQKFQFDHFAHVIPGPPENLTVVNKTSSSITLSWVLGTSMLNFPPGVTHRVKYQSTYDPKDQWHYANTSKLNPKGARSIFTLSELKYAHALYDIRVDMRSIKAQKENMWSKFASITVRTMSAVPGAPPITNIGSFEVNNNGTMREVYVYWQYIRDEMKNGEDFSYKVISVQEDDTERIIEPNETTSAYAYFKALSYKSYKFTIVSANEMGYSVNSSTVFVPNYVKRVPEPSAFTKIAFGEGVYELSWVAPKYSEIPIKNYTIFFCRSKRDRPYQCTGLLNWVEVSSDTTIFNITVPEDDNTQYQFAISANTENASSGMVWASCTVIHNSGISKMKSLWIDKIGSNFIEVGWKLDCSDRIGSIEGFKIDYCPIVSPVDLTCKDKINSVTIDDDPVASRGRVTNLRPYTTYMLAVSVITKHNSQSLQSDPLYNTTLEDAPDPPRHVQVKSKTNSSITIKWEKPLAINGILRYYEVHYSSKYENKYEKAEATEFTITGLTSYTEYDISVVAMTVYKSNHSEHVKEKTAISYPGQMRQPTTKYQNDTIILLGWTAPMKPGGPLNYYELQIKEKVNSENSSRIINTTDLQLEVPNCRTDKTYKVLYFSIRAVNIFEGKRLEGPWSQESEISCRGSTLFIYWMVALFGLCMLGVIFIVLKKLWQHCKIMRDVEVKLPPGLTPTVPNDFGLSQWPVPSITKSPNDDPIMRTDSSADEELLLTKKTECGDSHDRINSGDSSGCSSGHESVTSSIASGTNLSNTSDSGTEQPSESASRENSLRQRKTGSETLGWDSEIAWPNPKGYVTMPNIEKSVSPPSSWSGKSLPSNNYCVLGVDNVTSPDTGHGYVPVPVTLPHTENPLHTIKNTPYVTCDSLFTVNKPEPIDQSPTYVMAGHKGITGKLINIEPAAEPTTDTYLQQVEEKKGPPYVKTGDLHTVVKGMGGESDVTSSGYVKEAATLPELTDEPTRTDSVTCDNLAGPLNPYCRLGWESPKPGLAVGKPGQVPIDNMSVGGTVLNAGSLQRKYAAAETAKGYVPHRQFDTQKSLKED